MYQHWVSINEISDDLTSAYPEFEEYLATANLILFKLTGERYPGIRTITECHSVNAAYEYLNHRPEVINGEIYNLPLAQRGNKIYPEYQKKFTREIWLNHTDVKDIVEVVSGDSIVTREDYTLRSSRILRKETGLWNLLENEVCITYTHGMNPPISAKEAVTRLATELFLADHDKERCSLPSRVTSVQTQNMTVQMIDPMDFLERGRVGITSIDYFITAVNPSRSKKRPKIVSARRSRGTTRR